jgi:type IV secretory pathway VirJ component
MSRGFLFALLLCCLPTSWAMAAGPTNVTIGGRFGTVTVYRPATAPRSVVLFVSGDGGWHLGVTGMARHLADEGALVVGIDVRHYLAALDKAQSCVSLAADFELLSHDLQKQLGMAHYLAPVLAGYSSGATVVYAALAQAPAGTFTGAISFGFCADQDFHGKALCTGNGLHYAVNHRGDFVLEPQAGLEERWVAMQGQADQVCSPAAVDAFAARIPTAQVVQLPKVGHGFGVEANWVPQLRQAFLPLQAAVAPAERPHAAAAPALASLPVVEVPATGTPSEARRDEFAVLISGDGGWAGLDRGVAAAFAVRGIPVVGLDSLRYFWSARTPEKTAADVAAIIQHYQGLWHRHGVQLVGYSFGADVLPFVVNRLPATLAPQVAGVTLIGPSQSATFEIHVSDWLPGKPVPGVPLKPELERLTPAPLCLHGGGESGSACLLLPAAQSAQVGSGHHLGGDADGIVERILTYHPDRGATACSAAESCG